MPNAELLKSRISECGLSQQKIADQLNIAQPTLSLKINGKRPFLLDEALLLSVLLDIPDSEFSRYFF